MARRKRTDAEPLIFDAELADMPAELRWREWMNRIEAVLFAAPKPVEREALARVIGRNASIDLLIDDIREALRGKPYDVVGVAGGWAFRTRTAYADAIATSTAVPDRAVDLNLMPVADHHAGDQGDGDDRLGDEEGHEVDHRADGRVSRYRVA